jgi:hypothetical protein
MENLIILLITSISFILGYIFGRLDQENKNRHEKRYKYK